MKKRNICMLLLSGLASAAAYNKRELVKGVIELEKPQADLFTRVDEDGNVAYLCKNMSKAEDMLKDWIEYNGWEEADRVGEGYFYLNGSQETLLINREPVLGGRYLLWHASRPIES